MRAEEEAHRSAFVSTPHKMMEAWREGRLLLDVFDPAVLPSFVYQVCVCVCVSNT